MDEKEVLQTYAMFFISEYDSIETQEKLSLLRYIKEASYDQLVEMYNSGAIIHPDILDEDEFLLDFKFPLPGLPGGGASIDDIKKALKATMKAKEMLAKKYHDADAAIKSAIKNKIGDANKRIDALQHKLTGYGPKPESAGEKIASGARELASQAKEKVAGAAEKVGHAVGKAAEYAQGHPGATAAAAVGAAAALTAGILAYRRFISKAGRACKNAEDKKACRREYHNKGLQAQIDALVAGKSKCFKTGNPDKCKAKIDVKITSVKNKMK